MRPSLVMKMNSIVVAEAVDKTYCVKITKISYVEHDDFHFLFTLSMTSTIGYKTRETTKKKRMKLKSIEINHCFMAIILKWLNISLRIPCDHFNSFVVLKFNLNGPVRLIGSN